MKDAVAWVMLTAAVEGSVCGYCLGDGVVVGGRDGYRPCTPCRGTGQPPLGTPPYRDIEDATPLVGAA